MSQVSAVTHVPYQARKGGEATQEHEKLKSAKKQGILSGFRMHTMVFKTDINLLNMS